MSVTQIKDGNIVSLDASKLTGNLPAISGASLTGVTGKIVQVVNVQDKAYATNSTIVPYDQTRPQNTEGGEVMTLAITPTNASNLLYIDVVCHCTATLAGIFCVPLFQDSTADCIAVGGQSTNGASHMANIGYRHIMTAGTTSATTFKVRMGLNTAGTFSFNGDGQTKWDTNGASGRISSSITIWEIQA